MMISLLEEEDFNNNKSLAIFKLIKKMRSEKKHVDLLTLVEEIRRIKKYPVNATELHEFSVF